MWHHCIMLYVLYWGVKAIIAVTSLPWPVRSRQRSQDGDYFWYPKAPRWQKCFFKKQVNGVGGLASLTKRIGWAHIYVCQSRIMQFLSLTLFFNLSGNPVEWSYVSGRIKHHGPWAEVSVTWLTFQGQKTTTQLMRPGMELSHMT